MRLSYFASTVFKSVFATLAGAVVLSSSVFAQEEKVQSPAASLQPFVDRHVLAGAVIAIADREKILGETAVGWADLQNHQAMDTENLFWIASMSKPLTAAACMILVDEGKLKLDDPASKYLPAFGKVWVIESQTDQELKLRRPASPVTVRQLLSHTSGLPFRSELEQPTLDGLSLKDAVAGYAMTPLQSDPGTKFAYSNAGINTAARIIEVISGQDYETFMSERLFKPLDMKHTMIRPSKEQLELVAQSYKPSADGKSLERIPIGQLTYPLDLATRQPMPAGGYFSTATDVAHFGQMLLDHGSYLGTKILSPEAVAEMSRRQTPPTVKESYGLGCSVHVGAHGETLSFGHGGAFATDLKIDRSEGLVFVYLVQHAGFPGNAGGEILGTFHRKAIELYGKK